MASKGKLLEGSTEEEMKRGMLDDMSIGREGNVADLHSEMFSAAR